MIINNCDSNNCNFNKTYNILNINKLQLADIILSLKQHGYISYGKVYDEVKCITILLESKEYITWRKDDIDTPCANICTYNQFKDYINSIPIINKSTGYTKIKTVIKNTFKLKRMKF